MATPKVFISSVKELKQERNAVDDIVRLYGLEPNRYEGWAAASTESRERCLQEVRRSEMYILILGDSISDITRDEFETALEVMPHATLCFHTKGRRSKDAKEVLELARVHGYTKGFSSTSQLRTEVKKAIVHMFYQFLITAKEKPPRIIEEELYTDTILLEARESEAIPFKNLEEGDYFKGMIEETDGEPVNIYFVDKDNYAKWVNNKNFRGLKKKKVGALSFDEIVEETGWWYLIIENTATIHDREVSISLEREYFE